MELDEGEIRDDTSSGPQAHAAGLDNAPPFITDPSIQCTRLTTNKDASLQRKSIEYILYNEVATTLKYVNIWVRLCR